MVISASISVAGLKSCALILDISEMILHLYFTAELFQARVVLKFLMVSFTAQNNAFKIRKTEQNSSNSLTVLSSAFSL